MSARSQAKARKRSTRKASWSRRASSTCTPIMTARSPGAGHHAVLAERRDDRDHGQLRRRLRAVPPRPRPADPVDGRRRGHSRAGAERRHSLGMGELPRLHGLALEAQLRHRHRRAIAACRAPRLCDGRARRAPRSRHARGQQAMAALAGDAVRAGALGFSTSRTLNHRTSTGDFTPTLKAGEDELTAIAAPMHGSGPQRAAIRARLRPSTKTCR